MLLVQPSGQVWQYRSYLEVYMGRTMHGNPSTKVDKLGCYLMDPSFPHHCASTE